MIRTLLAILLLRCCVCHAVETPASEASIKEMLALSDARKIVDSMFAQVNGMMRTTMQQSIGAREVSPEEQKTLDSVSSKVVAVMQEELSWDKLEPLYVSIYQKSFTQEEVDGLIAFYKSPAGAALMKKTPVVMQQSMAAMQERMGPMMQKLQGIIRESTSELGAKKSKR